MLIRNLTVEDAPALRECRLFGLAESPEAFVVSHAEVVSRSLAQFEAELLDPAIHYVGAFDGAECIGFMRYVQPARLARRHTAEVRSVYVRRVARGQSIGSQLLRQLIRDAQASRLESLTLTVLADNAAARRLYESCGFQLYGTEPRAIRKEDRYIDLALYWIDLEAANACA